MMKKVFSIFLCVLLSGTILAATGCKEKNPQAGHEDPVVSQEMTTEDESPVIAPDDPPQVVEAPPAPAKEINRGGEEYDYDGWVEGAPGPDCSLLVAENWERQSMAVVAGTLWSDPQNSYAEFIYKYQWGDGVTIPPKTAIWEEFGEIIESGGDVEYGEFYSKYFSEAYYVKYNIEEYIYIHLYFFYYSQDIQLPHGPQTARALLYKNRTDIEDFEVTLNEAAFWKAAQSMYTAKGYKDGGGYIPYIPEVDGENIWEGGGHIAG